MSKASDSSRTVLMTSLSADTETMAESQTVTQPDPKQLGSIKKALGKVIFFIAIVGAIFLVITAVALVVQFVWGL
jgi:hypothetical protein